LNNFTIGKNSSASLELTCNLGETTQEQLKDIKWQLNYTVRKEMHGYHEDNDILATHFQVLF
jgi:IS30 family transposase